VTYDCACVRRGGGREGGRQGGREGGDGGGGEREAHLKNIAT